MKKYQYVLAFGDSTTAGAGLINDSFDWKATKKLSFPNLLADKLNIPCINIAWPGGSNDRSLRLLPETLLKYPDSLVLFTYTSFDRTEFFTLNPNLPQVPEESYTGVGINWLMVQTNKEHQMLNEMYLKYFYENTNEYNRYKIYNTLLTVQLFCEKYSKDFLHIFLYNHTLLPPVYQNNTYDAINKDHIYNFDFASNNITWEDNNEGFGSLEHWARSKKFSAAYDNIHIGQEAHNAFAEELYRKFV